MASLLLLALVVLGGSVGDEPANPRLDAGDRVEIQLGLNPYADAMWQVDDEPHVPTPSDHRGPPSGAHKPSATLGPGARFETARGYPSGHHLLRW